MTPSEAGKLGAIASRPFYEREKKRRREEYLLDPKLCKGCSSILLYEDRLEKIFCNRSCAATYNNTGRKRKSTRVSKNFGEEKHSLTNCKNCKIELNQKTHKEFCSLKCSTLNRWQVKLQIIENNNSLLNSKTARRYLKEKMGHICQICNLTEWLEQPIALVADHIDGNSDNWSLSNLRLICNNCDAQTPFYKAKNKGNGRAYRRERYKLGLSF